MALAGMTAALHKRCHGVSLFSVSRTQDGPQMAFNGAVDLQTATTSRLGSFRWSPELHGKARSARPDIVHSHCLFTDVNRLAGKTARRVGVPHLIAPCGHLQPDALKRSAWKKHLAMAAFQRRFLRRADCLHVKSEQELAGVRSAGFKGPAALIPNPVVPLGQDCLDTESFRKRLGLKSEEKIILFLGRIHPVKGLDPLVEAWSRLANQYGTWRLVIAGPDEGGFQSEILSKAKEKGCAHSICFPGPLDEKTKWSAYAASDLFVMPSDFENFGLSIAEALSAGLPVIASDGTPWKDLPTAGAGWYIPRTVEALVEALEDAMGLPDEKIGDMKGRARHLAEAYSPQEIAFRLEAVYSWLLGQGPRPECVTGS